MNPEHTAANITFLLILEAELDIKSLFTVQELNCSWSFNEDNTAIIPASVQR